MLVFFDESFRKSITKPDKELGLLCGIGIPEKELSNVVVDIYHLKYKHMGELYAKEKEIKGKELLKNYVFNLEKKGITSKNLALAEDLLNYLISKKLTVFGVVSFQNDLQNFKCLNVKALDKTFVYLFERVNIFMNDIDSNSMAKIIFDDRGYLTNKQNSEAITNFFVRSPQGLAMDRIIKTPLFAISQAQNVGLQLADFVTTIIGLKFSGANDIEPYWKLLKKCFYRWKHSEAIENTSLKVMK